jgi:prepilin-type N-terminal cleavage/methylation domain-containing protein
MNPTTPNPRNAASARSAFTLIELLTVIAIIGILAAILIPTVQRVRESANAAAGVSNVRQITQAMLAYAGDNRGLLPVSGFTWDGGGDIRTLLTAYLSKGPKGWPAAPLKVFQDPLATLPVQPNSPGILHYSANWTIFPYYGAGGNPEEPTDVGGINPRTQLDRIRNPGQIVFLTDGCQNPDWQGGVSGNFWNTGQSLGWVGTPADQSLAAAGAKGPNVDTSAAAGHIRWRMPGEKAKFGFGDGSVKILGPDQVFRRNLFF